MRLLVLALCAGLTAALPTTYDVAPAENLVGISSSEFHSSSTSNKESSHVSKTSYFVSTEGAEVIEITVAQADEYGLECFPSGSLTESAQVIVEETVDKHEADSSSAAGEGAASSSAASAGAASSSVAGGGAASSSAAGEGAASSSAVGEGAASSSAAVEGAASSSAAGAGAASSSAAGEGAASSSAAGEGAASSSAAGEDAASSSAAGAGAASSSAAGAGAASSSAAGEGAASSSAAGGGAATSSAAEEGAASSSAAGEGAASSSAAGEGAASSSAAGEGAASSSAAGEGAASSSAAGGGAASSSAAGGGAASSSAAGEGAASSSAAGEGAASSSAAGEGVASSSAASEGSASSSAAGSGSAASSAAGGGASSASSTYEEVSSSISCTCVPYYSCRDENIVTDGSGLIDIRLGSNPDSGFSSNSRCQHYLAVCCTKPEPRPLPEIVEELTQEPYNPSCGHRNPEGLHVNIHGFKDSESQFGEFTWMAIVLEEQYVGIAKKQEYLCGGSLITNNIILTAGHCVKGKDISRLVVRLGDWDTKSNAEIFPHKDVHVKDVVVHSALNERTLFNDVALLFLDHEVQLQPHIDTICLPESDQDNYDESNCVATGFGRDQFEGGVYQNVMKQVDLKVVSHANCEAKLKKTRLGRWFRLHDSFTCAGGKPGVDTCRGDGGSPLVCPSKQDPTKYVQVGIVAWGIGCGEGGVPGVYASVIKLLPWIKEHITAHPGSSVEQLTVTYEPVQVCITKQPVHTLEPVPQPIVQLPVYTLDPVPPPIEQLPVSTSCGY